MAQTTQYASQILNELQRTIALMADEEAEKLVDAILQAKKIFVAGAGRSGLMGRAFAMRLMHMGLEAYVVGETVTPGLAKGDLLILGSGSGGTKTLVAMAEKAKSLEASVALVTISPESAIGRLSDIIVKVHASPKEESDKGNTTIQPMGSLFEQSLLLFYDAVVLRLMEKKGVTSDAMFGKHANLE
jgi:6-phospho-3-hexuloisomerase